MSDSHENIIRSDAPPFSAAPRTRRQERRWFVVLVLLGLGSTILLTWFAGSAETLALLRRADLFFVACIALTQLARYVAMTFSLRAVTGIVKIRVPFAPLFQVVVAAQAANRTFVGGAAGLALRLAFFLRRGMRSGTFIAVETIEDVASLAAVAVLFLTGAAIVLTSEVGNAVDARWFGATIAGALILAFLLVALLRRRALVERIADASAQVVNRVVGNIARRNLYDARRVRGGVDDFYRALALARRDLYRVAISFSCSLVRLGSDAVALYFAYRAVGYAIAPGTALLIFIVSTSVATLAAVPGQIGVMETTLTLLSAALGVPLPVAVSASVLFRLISFWLPIPFGYAFAWNLQRREWL